MEVLTSLPSVLAHSDRVTNTHPEGLTDGAEEEEGGEEEVGWEETDCEEEDQA